jgi:hypothetical protein
MVKISIKRFKQRYKYFKSQPENKDKDMSIEEYNNAILAEKISIDGEGFTKSELILSHITDEIQNNIKHSLLRKEIEKEDIRGSKDDSYM